MIGYRLFEVEEIQRFKIAEDAIRFDYNIPDEEVYSLVEFYSDRLTPSYKYLGGIFDDTIKNNKYNELKKRHGFSEIDSPCIICFGCGRAFQWNYERIKCVCDVKYLSDNDKNKWGKYFFDTIECLSPDQLISIDNALVIISVTEKNIVESVSEQLDNMKIKYDYLDSLLKCVE